MATPKREGTLRVPRYSVNRSVTDRTIEHILTGLDSPRSLAVWMLYSNNEHQQLVDLTWSPIAYNSGMCARDSYLATELLSKSKFLNLDVDPEEVAWHGFLDTEAICADTNRRFRDLSRDPLFSGPNVWLLNATRRYVARFLGELPEDSDQHRTSFCPTEWFDSCSWGPGTTVRIGGKATNSANKFQRDAGMTKDCYILVSPMFPAACPLWTHHLREAFPTWGGRSKVDMWLESGDRLFLKGSNHAYFDKGNVILAVPKKAKTHRIISKEPGMNCYLQLGIGRMMRRRLLRHGNFDLRDQNRNQRLAFQSSLTGREATIDHKDASGLIATEAIRETFPSRWFSVMDSLRSKCGTYTHASDGRVCHIYYEKFCSMGNGFTFPLQSILFAAMAYAVCEYLQAPTDNVGVYGDDLVIPVEATRTYSQFCEFMGLRVNQTKSFSSGEFRESCGSHYWGGVDLKPFYLKERLRGLSSVYRTANGIRRLSSRNHSHGCDVRLLPAWRFLQNRVPKTLRFSIPEGYGDGGFVSNFDEATPATLRRWQQFDKNGQFQGIEGFRGYALTVVPVRYRSCEFGVLLARLSDLGLQEEDLDLDEIRFLSGSGNHLGLRRATRAQITMCSYHEWNDLGPWSSSKGTLFLRACSAKREVSG